MFRILAFEIPQTVAEIKSVAVMEENNGLLLDC